ncbi:proliferating cell nuclear antigen 1, putative [Eimeria tenella]|uniref:DNA sliding clamp PCNA n=1 Tax=Eimeria tenella TaxID=5802 RepID=U6KQS8_EIMTE|nr:proliferating cell nuclear antigen 1, putative [Eimeria tenella]CDJ38724.1 proliferating cell nuclear antigen 1, putative [Eimeria tenella]|eukprot:XP_013229480.1 proliferating cell nuclear antigen 1, putative [Eimeria tenella]
MLEARLQNAVVLKRVFEAMTCLVNEVNLDCDESGLKLQAMDQSHVALVSLKLEDVGFLHYRCDRPRSLGLNMSSVVKVFKLCSSQDTVSVQNEDEGDLITFVFENNAEEKTSTFSLRLMGIEQESLGVPDEEESDVEITFSAKEFASIVNTLKEFSDSVRIDVDKNGVKFITNGDIGGGEVVLKPREGNAEDDLDVGVDVQVRRPVSQTYAVKYLVFFAKAASLSNCCKLSLTSHRPISVKFDILDPIQGESRSAAPKLGHFKFYLAPKMDDEEVDAAAEAMQTEGPKPEGHVKPEEDMED